MNYTVITNKATWVFCLSLTFFPNSVLCSSCRHGKRSWKLLACWRRRKRRRPSRQRSRPRRRRRSRRRPSRRRGRNSGPPARLRPRSSRRPRRRVQPLSFLTICLLPPATDLELLCGQWSRQCEDDGGGGEALRPAGAHKVKSIRTLTPGTDGDVRSGGRASPVIVEKKIQMYTNQLIHE